MDGICDGNFLPRCSNPTETDRFHEDEYILTGVQTNIIGLSYRTPDLICKDDFRVEPSGQVYHDSLELFVTCFQWECWF